MPSSILPRIGREIDVAIARVLDHGIFISGLEVAALEAKLAAFCGARFAVACGNGTTLCRSS